MTQSHESSLGSNLRKQYSGFKLHCVQITNFGQRQTITSLFASRSQIISWMWALAEEVLFSFLGAMIETETSQIS